MGAPKAGRVGARRGAIGLRWRLAGSVAAILLVCLGIAFIAVYQETGTQVRREIDGELAGDAREFAHGLLLSGARSSAQARAAAMRYVDAQPFSESSTLLFAVIHGQQTASNSPELFNSSAPDDGETRAEEQRENRLSARLLTQHDGFSTLAVPDIGSLRIYKRLVTLPGAGALVLGVGEAVRAVARAQRGVARAFIVGGILALAGALLGAYLIGTRLSRPLRRIAAVAARVDAGELAPRIGHGGREPREVRVLTDAFNHMLDRLTDAFAGQRAFIADASHELRTPLTVIRGQLEVLASGETASAEEVRRVERLVQAEITRMSRLVDDLLLLARSEQAQFLRVEPVELAPFIEDLWQASTLPHARRFELEEPPQGVLLADPDRLAQALRNLLGNAVAHTSEGVGRVRLRIEAPGGELVRFVVEDDGPGIPAGERERVFERFHRIDRARDRGSGGTGLGLAIVAAVAVAHGGRVSAAESELGGTRIVLELPRFHTRAAPQRYVKSAFEGASPLPVK